MIKLPYEQIVEKVTKQADISEEDFKSKVDAKLDQLSGLVSREGAAHIVANEMGVKLLESTSGRLQVKNILPGLRNVEVVGKALQVYELREFTTNERQGKVSSFLMGDETGKIRVVMWGAQADNINNMEEGTVVKISGGFVKENRGYNELHLNEKSQLVINPEGEKVEVEVKKQESIRKSIDSLEENDYNVELLATVVQVFDPRFFEVCSQCGKRAKTEDGRFICPAHDAVEPDYSYVLNLVVDDGSDNTRVVFFRENMEKLLDMGKDEILEYKDSADKFEKIKTELLGNIIKVRGRVKKNLFFDRLELLANSVELNPDADEEIQRLNDEVKKVGSE